MADPRGPREATATFREPGSVFRSVFERRFSNSQQRESEKRLGKGVLCDGLGTV